MSIKQASSPVCKCVEDLNEKIADQNTEILIELFSGAVVIATQKVKSAVRGRPLLAVASYCPFCGKAYVKPGLEARVARREAAAEGQPPA